MRRYMEGAGAGWQPAGSAESREDTAIITRRPPGEVYERAARYREGWDRTFTRLTACYRRTHDIQQLLDAAATWDVDLEDRVELIREAQTEIGRQVAAVHEIIENHFLFEEDAFFEVWQ